MKAQEYRSVFVSLVFITCSVMLPAESMGTAFTYQGRLLENGEPGTGTYDLQCKLFDAKENGTQIGDTLVFEDGSSPDGYFTVALDFGVEVFNGEARYLEMAFRPWDSTDPGDFVVLADRVELTPTPYALQTRGIYVDPNQLVGIGTTDLSDAQLKIETTLKHGLYVKSQVTDGSQWGIQASAEGSTTGDSYGIRGASSSPIGNNTGLWGWARQPSTGDNIGVYGIASNTGTGDAFAGYFTWAKTYFEKNVGIGTTEPTGALYPESRTLEIEGDSPSIVLDDNLYTYQDDFEISNGGEKVLFRDATDGTDIMTLGLTGTIEGNVGIGTTDPQTKLDVSGTVKGTTSDTGGYGIHGVTTTSLAYGVYGENDSGSHGYLASANTGVYGIGTTHGYGGYFETSSEGKAVYGKHIDSGNIGVLGMKDHAGHFTGNVYITKNCSALSFTDRTPYPKDLKTAYDAVLSMERLPDGRYDETTKENQLDHSKLSRFIRTEDGNRDLSATVSCLNEVVKDLVKKIEVQQQLIETQNAQIQELSEILHTNNTLKITSISEDIK